MYGKHDPMKEALMARKGKGIDLSIVIGHNPEHGQMAGGEKDTKSQYQDLAPSSGNDQDMKHEMAEHDVGESVENLMNSPKDQHDDNKTMEEAVMDGMADHEKKAMEGGKTPKSLRDHARMAFLNKKGGKY